jgi:hypothetical protein
MLRIALAGFLFDLAARLPRRAHRRPSVQS